MGDWKRTDQTWWINGRKYPPIQTANGNRGNRPSDDVIRRPAGYRPWQSTEQIDGRHAYNPNPEAQYPRERPQHALWQVAPTQAVAPIQQYETLQPNLRAYSTRETSHQERSIGTHTGAVATRSKSLEPSRRSSPRRRSRRDGEGNSRQRSRRSSGEPSREMLQPNRRGYTPVRDTDAWSYPFVPSTPPLRPILQRPWADRQPERNIGEVGPATTRAGTPRGPYPADRLESLRSYRRPESGWNPRDSFQGYSRGYYEGTGRGRR